MAYRGDDRLRLAGDRIWDFSLVDPDNRRPVDYRRRCAWLRELDAALETDGREAVAMRLMATPRDDRLKLYVTTALLRFRRAHLAIFQRGGYHPLQTDGARREHIFAFARTHADEQVLVVIPRLVATLLPDADTSPVGERVWGDTRIELPANEPTRYHHVLTGDCVRARSSSGGTTLAAADVFARFPVAFLEARS